MFDLSYRFNWSGSADFENSSSRFSSIIRHRKAAGPPPNPCKKERITRNALDPEIEGVSCSSGGDFQDPFSLGDGVIFTGGMSPSIRILRGLITACKLAAGTVRR